MNPREPSENINRAAEGSHQESQASEIVDDHNVSTNEITSEKNIFQLVWKSRKLPKDTFNLISSLSLFFVLTIYVILGDRSTPNLIEDIRKISDLGFSFSTSILGFLVAGLAIFGAISDLSLFTNMARVRHSASGMSFLKYNFITMMYVFAIYLFLASLCFFILIFSQPAGPLSFFIGIIDNLFTCLNYEFLKEFFVKITFVFIATLTFYSLLLLKNFIFNIYHLFMVTVRWAAEQEEHAERHD